VGRKAPSPNLKPDVAVWFGYILAFHSASERNSDAFSVLSLVRFAGTFTPVDLANTLSFAVITIETGLLPTLLVT
jgi:hypothetical protein